MNEPTFPDFGKREAEAGPKIPTELPGEWITLDGQTITLTGSINTKNGSYTVKEKSTPPENRGRYNFHNGVLMVSAMDGSLRAAKYSADLVSKLEEAGYVKFGFRIPSLRTFEKFDDPQVQAQFEALSGDPVEME